MNQPPSDDPNIPRLEGIRDAKGENIFPDEEGVQQELPDRGGLLATPVVSEEGGPVFQPDDFEVTLQSRGKTVFILSWGILLVLGGVAAWIAPFIGYVE